jgi:hypothetical protein
LHTVACSVIQATCNREEKAGQTDEPLARFWPVVIETSIILAAMSLLKIQRSPELNGHLDLNAGQTAFFSAVVTLRELSLQNDDLNSRCATILGDLWNSKDAFKKNGAMDSLSCRVRNRLSMGVVFDCLWWWRQEFGDQGNPFQESRIPSEQIRNMPG